MFAGLVACFCKCDIQSFVYGLWCVVVSSCGSKYFLSFWLCLDPDTLYRLALGPSYVLWSPYILYIYNTILYREYLYLYIHIHINMRKMFWQKPSLCAPPTPLCRYKSPRSLRSLAQLYKDRYQPPLPCAARVLIAQGCSERLSAWVGAFDKWLLQFCFFGKNLQFALLEGMYFFEGEPQSCSGWWCGTWCIIKYAAYLHFTYWFSPHLTWIASSPPALWGSLSLASSSFCQLVVPGKSNGPGSHSKYELKWSNSRSQPAASFTGAPSWLSRAPALLRASDRLQGTYGTRHMPDRTSDRTSEQVQKECESGCQK